MPKLISKQRRFWKSIVPITVCVSGLVVGAVVPITIINSVRTSTEYKFSSSTDFQTLANKYIESAASLSKQEIFNKMQSWSQDELNLEIASGFYKNIMFLADDTQGHWEWANEWKAQLYNSALQYDATQNMMRVRFVITIEFDLSNHPGLPLDGNGNECQFDWVQSACLNMPLWQIVDPIALNPGTQGVGFAYMPPPSSMQDQNNFLYITRGHKSSSWQPFSKLALNYWTSTVFQNITLVS